MSQVQTAQVMQQHDAVEMAHHPPNDPNIAPSHAPQPQQFWQHVYAQPRPTYVAPPHILQHMMMPEPDAPPETVMRMRQHERQRFEQQYAESLAKHHAPDMPPPPPNPQQHLYSQFNLHTTGRAPANPEEYRRLLHGTPQKPPSKPSPVYVIHLPVNEQNQFLRRCFGLLCLALFVTALASYVLIGLHQVNNWVNNYPWLLVIVTAVSVVVFILYMTPWFRKGSFSVQIFTYICVCCVCTALVTIMGTYVESGMLLRVVGFVALIVLFLFVSVLQDNTPFKELPAYVFVTTLALIAMLMLIWLPNRDYYGTIPNAKWLSPPGNTVDVLLTTGLTWYVSCCLIRSVTVTMKIAEARDYVDAAIAAYFDIIKLFPAWLMSWIWGRWSPTGAGNSGGSAQG